MGMVGHSVGWPVVRGGTGILAAALAAHLRSLGGTIETGRRVTSLRELPPSRVRLLDLVPRDIDTVCGEGVEARLEGLPVPHPGLPQLTWAAISGQDTCSFGDGDLHSTIRACEAWRRPLADSRREADREDDDVWD